MSTGQKDLTHLRVGEVGEDIAAKWLKGRGFSVLERNYRKKWGEIDVVALKGDAIHFVEVKTVSYETIEELKRNVSRGTYRPEENVHPKKRRRLSRAIQTWISGNNFTGNFQVDVLTVRIVSREKYAVVEAIENVILD